METKDINRIQDIKNKPSDKHLGLANKMSKLITNGEKAKGRYEASCIIFGNHHEITKLFAERYLELNGNIVKVKDEVKPKIVTPVGLVEEVIVPVVNSIKRSKEDFPLSKKVKFEGEIGTVVSHETDNEDVICILLDGKEKAIEVNIYKLKFA